VINELGYVGLGLLVVALLTHLRNIVRINRHGEGLTAIFHLAVLVAALLLNVSETNFMRTTHLWWIILTTSIISAHVHLRQLGQAALPQAIGSYLKLPEP